MTRRWAVIFWSSLACLVGFTLVAAKLGLQTWDMIGLHMVGMVMAGVVAFGAMLEDARAKWPAGVAFVCAVPMSTVALLAFANALPILDKLGSAGALTFAASLCTSFAALAVIFMPVPPAKKDTLAEARVR